jgi:hypothetical protein
MILEASRLLEPYKENIQQISEISKQIEEINEESIRKI